MKKFIYLFSLLCIVFIHTATSQVVEIPEKAKTHFNSKYPNAKNVDWTNQVTAYKVKFVSANQNWTAHYTIDGKWDYSEKDLSQSKFPEAIKDAIKKSRFSDWKVSSTGYVENNQEEKLYRIEVKKGIEKHYVFYDKTGKEVKSVLSL